MANDFSDLGLEAECEDDLVRFTLDHKSSVKFYRTELGRYAVMKLGAKIRLWYYGDSNAVYASRMEMWHRSGRTVKLTECEWRSCPEGQTAAGLLGGFLEEGSTGFPVNITVVNACEFPKRLNGGTCELDVSLFSQGVRVFEGEKAYAEADSNGMAAQSCIPIGTFPAGEDEDFEPSSAVFLNGIVHSAEHRTNPATKLTYWKATLDCLGLRLDALIADDDAPKGIAPGNVVTGYYWLSGKLVRIVDAEA